MVRLVLGSVSSVGSLQASFWFLETSLADLEVSLRGFMSRDDIGIILIVQYLAEMVRHVLETNTLKIPVILEIPNKDHPYDPARDHIIRAAKVCRLAFVPNLPFRSYVSFFPTLRKCLPTKNDETDRFLPNDRFLDFAPSQ